MYLGILCQYMYNVIVLFKEKEDECYCKEFPCIAAVDWITAQQ